MNFYKFDGGFWRGWNKRGMRAYSENFLKDICRSFGSRTRLNILFFILFFYQETKLWNFPAGPLTELYYWNCPIQTRTLKSIPDFHDQIKTVARFTIDQTNTRSVITI